MTVEEARVRSLDRKAREVLGEEDGATFMEIVSERPTDVATKHDIESVRHDIESLKEALVGFEARVERRFEAVDRRFEAVDHRFEVLEHQWGARLERELRQFNMRLTAMMATFVMGGMVLAAGIARISV